MTDEVTPTLPPSDPSTRRTRFADLFAGIGGFHAAIAFDDALIGECVFASEINGAARNVYRANYGLEPHGDIWPIALESPHLIPDHDLLF